MRSSEILTVDQKWESMFRIWPIYYFKIQIQIQIKNNTSLLIINY